MKKFLFFLFLAMVLLAWKADATITSITLTAPANDSWTNDSTPDFQFTAISDINASFSCELFVDDVGYGINASVLNNTATTITANSSLAQGTRSWYINCTDINGTVKSAVWQLKVDTQAPIPSIETSNESWFSTQTPTINFNLTDNLDSIINYTFYVDGASNVAGTASNATSSSATLSSLSEGSHSLILEATDEAGNSQNSSSYTIYVDVTAPTIALSAPSNGTWTNDSTPSFQFTPVDNLASTLSCELFIDGTAYGKNTSVINGTLTAIVANSSLSDGTKNWYINCTDNASNTGQSATWQLKIDTVAPTTTATAVKADSSSYTFGSWTNSAYVNVTLNATDSGAGVDTILYCTDTTNSCTPNLTYTNAIQISAEGTTYIRFRANDSAGNIETVKNKTIKIDKTAPSLVPVSPTQDENVSGTINVQATWSDSLSGAAVARFKWINSTDSGTWTALNGTLDTTTLSDGSYNITFWVNDSAGNINQTNVSINVDNTAPTFSFVSPSNNSWHNSSFVINISASETLSSAKYRWENSTTNGSWTSMTNLGGNYWNATLNISQLADGNYTLHVNITDNYGNSNDSTLLFWVDSTAPTISSFTLSDTSVYKGDTVTASCSATDNLDSSVSTSVTGIDTSTTGTKTAKCTATDNAGNIATSTVSYTVKSKTIGSSGGSGGAVSVETTHLWTLVEVGESILMKISDERVAFTELSIKVRNRLTDVSLSVENLPDPPVKLEGNVYQYLRIEKRNIEDKDIDSVKIKFKVKKSWLNENNVEQLVLKKFIDGEWIEIPTNKIDSSSIYEYYEAITTGLSYFAIAEKKIMEEMEEQEEAKQKQAKQEETEELEEEEFFPYSLPQEEKKKSFWLAILVLSALIALLAVAFILRKR